MVRKNIPSSTDTYAPGMAKDGRRYVDDVPPEAVKRLRAVCSALPDAYEEQAWAGTRWRVRGKTFAHVLGIEFDGGALERALVFRSEGEELEMLRHAGPPFRVLGWGRDALGLTNDDDTDWDEVAELVTESFCVMAPKKLAAQVDRPPPP